MKLTTLLLLLFVATLSTSAKTFSGIVRDSSGAAIANAHVIIHWDSSGSNYLKDNLGTPQDIDATTDAQGRFTVDLPPVFTTSSSPQPRSHRIATKFASKIKTSRHT